MYSHNHGIQKFLSGTTHNLNEFTQWIESIESRVKFWLEKNFVNLSKVIIRRNIIRENLDS